MTIVSEPLWEGWAGTAADAAADADVVAALIARCLQGDEPAYSLLYDRYAGILYRLVYSLLQHRQDAEEVLQDTFEYAFRKLHRYDPTRAGFKTWLYQIAISRSRNKRRRKWLPTFSLNHGGGEQIIADRRLLPEERLDLSQRQRAVWQALQALSPKLRETAVLRYYEGLSYADIGKILAIPPKTAESRMRLAHKKLQTLLEEQEL